MKVNPRERERDLCFTSLDLLARASRRWFKERDLSPVWFPDLEVFPQERPSDVPMHVVLFGGFLRRFFESGNWPMEKCFLWVLSMRVKEVLVRALGVPGNAVGVLPREELMPATPRERQRPLDLHQSSTAVFGGRLSPTKNLEMTLRTIFYLQTEHHLPVRMECFGDFDDQVHPDRGRRELFDYKSFLLGTVESWPWKTRPRFHAKEGVETWCAHDFENPFLINLSTFICEDFDVSLAQAQQKGWPAVISDWGGHGDAQGENLFKVFSGWIGDSHEPAVLVDLKARHLAGLLAEEVGSFLERGAPTKSPFPVALEIKHLDALRRRCLTGWAEAGGILYREGLEAFSDTAQGRRFFSHYRRLFSGEARPEAFWMVLVNDFHPAARLDLSLLDQVCLDLLKQARALEKGVMFVSARECTQPFYLLHLEQAEKVILPFEAPSFAENLKSVLNLGPRFVQIKEENFK